MGNRGTTPSWDDEQIVKYGIMHHLAFISRGQRNRSRRHLQESIEKFGEGDQFQLFLPEHGARIVARITKVAVYENDNRITCLGVDFVDAFLAEPGDGVFRDTSPEELTFYNEAPLDKLSSRTRDESGNEYGDGCLILFNIPAEQVILLVKPEDKAFIKRSERSADG